MTVLVEAHRETWHGIHVGSHDLCAYLASLARHGRFIGSIFAEQLGNESPLRTVWRNGGSR